MPLIPVLLRFVQYMLQIDTHSSPVSKITVEFSRASCASSKGGHKPETQVVYNLFINYIFCMKRELLQWWYQQFDLDAELESLLHRLRHMKTETT